MNYGYIKVISSRNENDSQIIYFPSMPESIDLAREANFNVTSNIVFPDGLALYDHTSPLEIPLSFSVHYMDDYCTDGSVTLLKVAAQLQSLTLPTASNLSKSNATQVPQTNTATANEITTTNNSVNNKGQALLDSASASNISFPPACQLRIILSGANNYGIDCVGYVKSVKTKLKGPWMQVSDGGSSMNLPTSADYDITFVHNPGYSNIIGAFDIYAQAFGPEVYANLYNTTAGGQAVSEIATWSKPTLNLS